MSDVERTKQQLRQAMAQQVLNARQNLQNLKNKSEKDETDLRMIEEYEDFIRENE